MSSRPHARDLVYTYVFAPGDEPHVDQIVGAFEAAGGDVETLQKLLSEHDVFAAVPGRESVTIDVGSLSADQAAQQIVDLLER